MADRGNTIVVIERNLDVIKRADWIITLGPEDGSGQGGGGGEEVAAHPARHTGRFLAPLLGSQHTSRSMRQSEGAV